MQPSIKLPLTPETKAGDKALSSADSVAKPGGLLRPKSLFRFKRGKPFDVGLLTPDMVWAREYDRPLTAALADYLERTVLNLRSGKRVAEVNPDGVVVLGYCRKCLGYGRLHNGKIPDLAIENLSEITHCPDCGGYVAFIH